MPRKPNYKFERFERERAKAAKKAARIQARADRKSAESEENPAAGETGDDTLDAPAVESGTGQD